MRTSLAYALAADALEPGDALAVERARTRPGAAARLDQAAAALGASSTPGAGPWLIGDVGTFMLGELHLDAGPWHPGDRLPLLLDGDLPGDARLSISVFTRGAVAVLSPVEGTWVRLDQLRRTDDGRWALDLVLDDVEGLHRVEVTVLTADGEVLARAEAAVRVAR